MRPSLRAILIEPETRWSGFPPQYWLNCFGSDPEQIDQDELARAEWLWQRRPKRLLFKDARVRVWRILLLLACVIVLCCFDVAGILAAAGLSVIAAMLLTADLYRSVFWKRDYDAAIARLPRR